MKVGIVTIVDYTNYGNRLQNYAVFHMLQKYFNVDAITLTSNKNKSFENGNYVLWVKNYIAKKICVFPVIAEKKFGNNIMRWTNFCKWTKKNIPTKIYYECEHLPENLNEKYDFFIAGSDQIWNYNFASKKFYDYFLKFSDKSKNIALSASIGISNIPKEWENIYKEGLNNFSNISIRENEGKMIIKDLIEEDVPVLIDPTLMLTKEEWEKVSKKPRVDINKPYILKYYLGDKQDDNIEKWAMDNGYQIYELLNEEISELYSAGPGEFISLIKNADLVCSDSFHCIVFSIIFSRPFIVYSRKGNCNMISRLQTLLDLFGFQNRWDSVIEEKNYLNCDFSNVQTILIREKKRVINYLEQSLGLKE